MHRFALSFAGISFLIVGLTRVATGLAQQRGAGDSASAALLLVPDAVWDGVADAPERGWVVLLRGSRIQAVGPASATSVPAGAERIELKGTTLIPGLIEGHSHLFLHPYNETLWDDQVLKEPVGLRMARAVASAEATLHAGITTERDLGTEGAGNFDVQLKRAIDQGIVPGPRLITVTRAIVATGSYGPRPGRLLLRAAAGRRRGQRGRRDYPGGAQPDCSWRRLDQGVRRLSVGPGRRSATDLLPGRAASAGGNRPRQRQAGGRPCHHGRGDASGGSRRRRNGRAWRWGTAESSG